MTLPPAVVIHGLDHARTALGPGRAVLLLSGAGAGAYAGAMWWREMIAAALGTRREPDALDCADQAGRALEALTAGCGIVVLRPCPSFESVAARATGALVLPARPPALDLAQRGAIRHLDAWLRGDSSAAFR